MFFYDYMLIIVPIVAGMLAQVIKFLIFSFKHGFDWHFLFEYGHMPSSHAAMMSALVVALGYQEGVRSPIFATAFILTLLVISDALRLRVYIGSYGRTLNSLLDHLNIENEADRTKLKERVGHRPSEIFWGIFLGAITTLVLAELIKILVY